MRVVVLTVDQRGSSRVGATDRVPAALSWLDALDDVDNPDSPVLLRPFERTAGDEFQGVLDDPSSLVRVLEQLLRESSWNIGIGIGAVEHPLPQSTRAGRGSAFLHAREAVTSAKSSPWHLRVEGDQGAARYVESAIWLWAAVLGRRTAGGWEVADLVDAGLRYDVVAQRLGISQSAVSQRARAAGIVEGVRGRELVTELVSRLLSERQDLP